MKFKIELKKFETIRELPNAWSPNNYMELLDIMEFGDTATIPSTDLKEMCLLTFTDFEPSLIRLLVAGMPKNTLLNRLFSDQLEGQAFHDAKDIIWQYSRESLSDTSITIEVISSVYWFHDLKFIVPFEAELTTTL